MKTWLLGCLMACGSSSATEAKLESLGSAEARSAAQRREGSIDAAYKADIDNLCNVIERSGSIDLEPNDRMYKTATWLAANLKTEDGRKFLATIQPLAREPKATALDAEAKRVGLATCPLSAEWRK